jgi:hypothetical protein
MASPTARATFAARQLQRLVRRRAFDLRPRYACRVPDVIEDYKEFAPPCDAKTTIEDLLGSVPSGHLIGLRRIVLTNTDALPATRKRSWSWSRGRKARHGHVLGLYHGDRQANAWIELFVDRVLANGPPTWMLRHRFVRTFIFGPVLFHEIGHHIHARISPEHRDREDVADDWSKRLMRRHVRRRHAVARRVLAPFVRLARAIFAGRVRRPGRAAPRRVQGVHR